ncbi:MAG: 50S ribosomal protein L21 [Candidatus Dadabacteria bacterium]|nr:MAG: 50S ribosomal protein L21 [Candidatus Dadabacteria bacterium]
MYAVIETGGKQYRVTPNATVRVEKLEGESGAEVTFDRVLLVNSGEQTTIGTPVVDGAVVRGKIVDQVRGDKIIVFKKRRRKDSKKKQGHRQNLTVVEITAIEAGA